MNMAFEVYKKEFRIANQPYELLPLPGKFLGKLYSVLGKIQHISEGSDVFSSLDEKTVGDLHEVATEMFARSYPSKDRGELEMFVSQNLIEIIPAIVEVHFNNKKD
jgi:hypothetical protein